MKTTLSLGIVIGAAFGKGYFSTFDRAEQKAAKLGRAMAETNRKLTAAQNVARYRTLLTELRAKQEAAGGASRRLAAGIADVERRYRQAKHEARAYGIAIGDVVREQRRLERESARLQRRLEHLGRAEAARRRLDAIKGRALGAAGVLYGAGRIGAQAIDLEQAQVRLSTVVNAKDVGKALAASRRHALAFARRNLASETDILNIEYALNSAGLDASAARVGSELVAKVAQVTGGAAESVGEVIATAFNNLGDQIEGDARAKLTRIGELLTKTQFKFQIRDFAQLGESMKYGTSVMSQYNIALEQGVTLLGALNSAGLQGEMAGTALAATMRNMSKAAKAFGFELARNEKGQLDVIATLKRLRDAIGGFDNMTQETGDALQQVFGDEGIRGVVALGKQLDKLAEAQRDVAEGSKGLIDKSYARFLRSTGGQVTLFQNNLRILGETIAGTVLPAVNAVLTPLTRFMIWIGKGIERFPVIGWLLGGVAAGFGIYAATLGIVTAAQWAFNAAMLANPVGLLVAGVAVLAGAAWTLYKNWNRVMAWFARKLDWLKDKFGWVGRAWHAIFGGENERRPERERVNPVPPRAAPRQLAHAALAGAMVAAPAPAPAATAIHQDNRAEYHVQVNVHGGDPEDVKRAVFAALAERENAHAARFRSAAFDAQGAW